MLSAINCPSSISTHRLVHATSHRHHKSHFHPIQHLSSSCSSLVRLIGRLFESLIRLIRDLFRAKPKKPPSLHVPPPPMVPVADLARQQCVNAGVLLKRRDYLYLKLDPNYLQPIFDRIKKENPDVKAPDFYGNVGPHISVVRHDEWKGTPPQKIEEISRKYLFTPTSCDVIQHGRKRLWVLTVNPEPALIELRRRLGLSDTPHNHAFHITIAQQ